MRTPSLRRRAVTWSVAVLALFLLAVGVSVGLALGAILEADQRERLYSLASLSGRLSTLDIQDLADRLTGQGVTAVVVDRASGTAVVGIDAPTAGSAAPVSPRVVPLIDPSSPVVPGIVEQDGLMTIERTVRPGVVVRLTADTGSIAQALDRYRWVMTSAGAVALLAAAVTLWFVIGRALRPLTALTDAARATAAGGRGRRLAPADPRTDLGRAAREFDLMLEELEGAEQEAESAAERLAQFLSDASHELRTPIAGVSAAAERLIRDRLDESDLDLVALQIVQEARRAGRLVDDLLLASRLHDLRIERTAQDLRGLLEDAARRFGDGPPPMHVSVSGADGITIIADADRIEQVLANLLRNARSAGAGSVRIRALEGPDRTVIRISDDGPGVGEPWRERVFERFARIDPQRSAGGGGAGLGLPIARGLVAAHAGTLVCTEPIDGDLPGAVFVLELPNQSADHAVVRT